MIQAFLLVTLSFLLTLNALQSGAPRFDSTFETREINAGSKASVLCNATRDSPVQYKWYNTIGERVSRKAIGALSTIETTGGSRLLFDPVSSSHEGVYTCTAENQHGLVSKVYQIVVNSENVTTNETHLTVEVLNVTDSSVECFVEASNPVQSYEVKYYELKIRKTISFVFEGPTVVFDELVPGGQYYFRFRAVLSNYSTSGWSRLYEVVLLPKTPEAVLRSLTGNALQIEWFKTREESRRSTIDGYSLSYGTVKRTSDSMKVEEWEPVQYLINIEIRYSYYTTYTIGGLFKNNYYEIRLRAHTKAGYGNPFVTKIYVA